MKFNRHDHVKRRVGNTFWDGLVLAYVQRLKDGEVVIVERFDYTMFICTENQLELIASAHQACKHSQGFMFRPGNPPGWECNTGCGYHTNFNPEFHDSIAYLSEPKKGPVIDLKASKF